VFVRVALVTARNYDGVRQKSRSMMIESLEVTRSQSVQQREVMLAIMFGPPITLSAQSSGGLSNYLDTLVWVDKKRINLPAMTAVSQ